MRKIKFFIVILLIVYASGYFFVLPTFEKKEISRVADDLNALPGKVSFGKIDVNYLTRGVTIYDFAYACADKNYNLTVKVKKIYIKGLNRDFMRQGNTTLADEVVATNITFGGMFSSVADNALTFHADVKIDSYKIEDLKGNFAALNQVVIALKKEQKITDLDLVKLGNSLADIYVKKVNIVGYENIQKFNDAENNTTKIFMGNFEANNLRVFAVGASSFSDLKIYKNDLTNPMITIDDGSSKSFAIPNFISFMGKTSTRKISKKVVQELFTADRFEFDSLLLKGIVYKEMFGTTLESYPADSMLMSGNLTSKIFNFSCTISNITVAKMPQIDLPTMLISNNLNISVENPFETKSHYIIKSDTSEPYFGDISFVVDVLQDSPSLFKLNNVKLSVKDKNIVNKIMTLILHTNDVAAQRKLMAPAMISNLFNSNETLNYPKISDDLRDFLSAPGTITLTSNLNTPILESVLVKNFKEPVVLLNILNVTSEYIPLTK